MFNRNRTWMIADANGLTADEFAEKLTEYIWTLCQGWRRGDVIYLNDSLSEDGASEWAIVLALNYRPAYRGQCCAALHGSQFESVTFGWMTTKAAAALVREFDIPEKVCELADKHGYFIEARLHEPGEPCPACR